MNYEEAKAQGFRYVTRNPLGGECVHKTKPKRVGGYWESPGWRYIQGGTACPEKNVIMSINIAIDRQKQQLKGPVVAEIERKKTKRATSKSDCAKAKEKDRQKKAATREAEKQAKAAAREAEKRARAEEREAQKQARAAAREAEKLAKAEARAKKREEKKAARKRTGRRMCKTCGLEFDAAHGGFSYCSDICRTIGKRRNNAKWKEKQPKVLGGLATCKHCGQQFRRSRHYIAYCSDACRDADIAAKHQTYTKTCKACGNPFTTKDRRRQYCSVNCQSAAYPQQMSPAVRICKECGKEFKPSHGRKYCSAQCCHDGNLRAARERRAKEKQMMAQAEAEARQPLPIFNRCKECRRIFQAGSRHQVYCSSRCREEYLSR